MLENICFLNLNLAMNRHDVVATTQGYNSGGPRFRFTPRPGHTYTGRGRSSIKPEFDFINPTEDYIKIILLV